MRMRRHKLRTVLLSALAIGGILWISNGALSQFSFVDKSKLDEASTVIRNLVINEDDFLRHFDINTSMKKALENSLGNVPKTFVISLTKAEQMTFENTTDANMIREAPHVDPNEIENLLEKGPFAFLPQFKSPCWYDDDRKLRCLPYFFLIGAAKAGTSDLYSMLRINPDFVSPKEVHWLTRLRFCKSASHTNNKIQSCSQNFEWYTDIMARQIYYKNKVGHVPRSYNALGAAPEYQEPRTSVERENPAFMSMARKAIIGDCSASTMWDNFNWPLVKENSLPLEPTLTNADFVYHLNSKTKILAILRNPISRLYSDFVYFSLGRTKDPADFHRQVVDAVKHFYSCSEKFSVKSCVNSIPLKEKITRVRLNIGIYFIHLQEWYRVFPRSQIMVLKMEDYSKNKTATMQKVYNFLEFGNITMLPEFEEHVIATVNKSKYQNRTMWTETRFLLYAFYKPFNQALAQLLKDSRFDYGPY